MNTLRDFLSALRAGYRHARSVFHINRRRRAAYARLLAEPDPFGD